MKLGIATVCPHVYFDGRWWSYEPLVLEMNVWSELFDQIVVVSPLDQGPPPKFWAPYQRSDKISVIPFRQDKGCGLEQETTTALEIPRMLFALTKAAIQTDAFHLRAPCNISLVASLLLPLLKGRLCAKYAGQWNDYPGEPLSYRIQRAILKSRWWHGPVTVYGKWPDQPPHVIPFFTSVLNERQIARAKLASQQKATRRTAIEGLRILYVGRLSAAKNVGVLIEAIARLKEQQIIVTCNIVGDGAERNALEKRIAQLCLEDQIKFAGSVDFEKVLDFYEKADVLVLVSETEGWPKAIAEAMAFGLVCIGSDRGLVPWMLGEGRGLVVPPGDAKALAASLRRLIAVPAERLLMGQHAAAWSQGYSLDGLREAVRELLSASWQMPISALSPLPSLPGGHTSTSGIELKSK